MLRGGTQPWSLDVKEHLKFKIVGDQPLESEGWRLEEGDPPRNFPLEVAGPQPRMPGSGMTHLE
jgi:hypothetical protein